MSTRDRRRAAILAGLLGLLMGLLEPVRQVRELSDGIVPEGPAGR